MGYPIDTQQNKVNPSGYSAANSPFWASSTGEGEGVSLPEGPASEGQALVVNKDIGSGEPVTTEDVEWRNIEGGGIKLPAGPGDANQVLTLKKTLTEGVEPTKEDLEWRNPVDSSLIEKINKIPTIEQEQQTQNTDIEAIKLQIIDVKKGIETAESNIELLQTATQDIPTIKTTAEDALRESENAQVIPDDNTTADYAIYYNTLPEKNKQYALVDVSGEGEASKVTLQEVQSGGSGGSGDYQIIPTDNTTADYAIYYNTLTGTSNTDKYGTTFYIDSEGRLSIKRLVYYANESVGTPFCFNVKDIDRTSPYDSLFSITSLRHKFFYKYNSTNTTLTNIDFSTLTDGNTYVLRISRYKTLDDESTLTVVKDILFTFSPYFYSDTLKYYNINIGQYTNPGSWYDKNIVSNQFINSNMTISNRIGSDNWVVTICNKQAVLWNTTTPNITIDENIKFEIFSLYDYILRPESGAPGTFGLETIEPVVSFTVDKFTSEYTDEREIDGVMTPVIVYVDEDGNETVEVVTNEV